MMTPNGIVSTTLVEWHETITVNNTYEALVHTFYWEFEVRLKVDFYCLLISRIQKRSWVFVRIFMHENLFLFSFFCLYNSKLSKPVLLYIIFIISIFSIGVKTPVYKGRANGYYMYIWSRSWKSVWVLIIMINETSRAFWWWNK